MVSCHTVGLTSGSLKQKVSQPVQLESEMLSFLFHVFFNVKHSAYITHNAPQLVAANVAWSQQPKAERDRKIEIF